VPDETIRCIARTWAPRRVASGAGPGGCRRAADGLERWDHWDGAWTAPGRPHEDPAHEADKSGPLVADFMAAQPRP
jgi:hypothetical protein